MRKCWKIGKWKNVRVVLLFCSAPSPCHRSSLVCLVYLFGQSTHVCVCVICDFCVVSLVSFRFLRHLQQQRRRRRRLCPSTLVPWPLPACIARSCDLATLR